MEAATNTGSSRTKTREDLQAEIDSTHEALKRVIVERDDWRKASEDVVGQHAVTKKHLADAQAEIASLKDELHRMTVTNARLEGYRERVEKFDPVTEQQQYDDHCRKFSRHDIAEGCSSIESILRRNRYGGEAPWYRRG